MDAKKSYDESIEEVQRLLVDDPARALMLLARLRREMVRAGDRTRTLACIFTECAAARILGDAEVELSHAKRLVRHEQSFRTISVLADVLFRAGDARTAKATFETAFALATDEDRRTGRFERACETYERCRDEPPPAA